MKTTIIVLSSILVLAARFHTGLACSYYHERMDKFIAQEYVFLGEVTGIVGPIRSNRILKDAWGLEVRITHGFNLPGGSSDHIEVYPLGLTNACEKTGTSQEALKQYYPTGSRVRVVGLEATTFEAKSAEGVVRLELTEMNSGLVARNNSGDGFDTTPESVYDYKWDTTHTRAAQDKAAVFYYYSRLGDFELRKDLIRLRDARKESERFSILKRIADYSYYDIDYQKLVKNHIQNKRRIDQLMMLRPR